MLGLYTHFLSSRSFLNSLRLPSSLSSFSRAISPAPTLSLHLQTNQLFKYGIVIDSGSSRSTMFLYEWPGEKENETGVVKEKTECKVNAIPISEMTGDKQKDAEVWEAFKNCTDQILKEIPVEKQKSTSLFLGATAGMRLLQLKDESRSEKVMRNLRTYLNSLPFNFQNASIISGEEEGLYGWITVNYLMDNFLERNLLNTYMRPHGAKTVGSMDLGGASTQIAFAVQEPGQGPDYMHVKLYGYPYIVYTHSFLCYGKNEADKRFLAKVLESTSNQSYKTNPCYQKGYNETINLSAVYDTQCNQKPKNYNPDQSVLIVGTGDTEQCGKLVESIFDFKTCSSSQCSFNGVEQPPVTGDFMAYAGFFFISKALGKNGTSELDDFELAMREFCTSDWEDLTVQKKDIKAKYLKTYCFGAHYVHALLVKGYKFDNKNWKNIHFQRYVGNTSIGWSLGYMLSMSNMIPSDVKVILPIADPVFSGLIFLFTALIIIGVVLVSIIIVRMCF
uniref:Ectonucleoside triphosphate diphosphohydrolase 3 n=1 Tax=Oryzias latipes TaxID=8090 RepID=A0A3P9LKH6_ORYLA